MQGESFDPGRKGELRFGESYGIFDSEEKQPFDSEIDGIFDPGEMGVLRPRER